MTNITNQLNTLKPKEIIIDLKCPIRWANRLVKQNSPQTIIHEELGCNLGIYTLDVFNFVVPNYYFYLNLFAFPHLNTSMFLIIPSHDVVIYTLSYHITSKGGYGHRGLSYSVCGNSKLQLTVNIRLNRSPKQTMTKNK